MSEIVGLDHVQVVAPPGSRDVAHAFYGGLLGLEEVEMPPVLAARGGIWFALGERELHVGLEERFVPAHRAHPALNVSSGDALEALAARLKAAGYEPNFDHELPGARRFYVSDPFGNRLELISRGH
jgi:catechol 2,3-dioxygenase-like lactoylglutathione lyase family enzyme